MGEIDSIEVHNPLADIKLDIIKPSKPQQHKTLSTKYRSNRNYESVRQAAIALLNSYDPTDSIIDNSEAVQKSALKLMDGLITYHQEQLTFAKEHPELSYRIAFLEGTLNGVLIAKLELEKYLL